MVGPCLYSSDRLFQLQPMPASAVSHCWNQGGYSLVSQSSAFFPLYGRAPCHHFYFFYRQWLLSEHLSRNHQKTLPCTKEERGQSFFPGTTEAQIPPVNSLWVEKWLPVPAELCIHCVYSSKLNVHGQCSEANWQWGLCVNIIKLSYSPKKGLLLQNCLLETVPGPCTTRRIAWAKSCSQCTFICTYTGKPPQLEGREPGCRSHVMMLQSPLGPLRHLIYIS